MLLYSGADPENVEPNLFFGLIYKDEQGGVRRVRPPLNPRLVLIISIRV